MLDRHGAVVESRVSSELHPVLSGNFHGPTPKLSPLSDDTARNFHGTTPFSVPLHQEDVSRRSKFPRNYTAGGISREPLECSGFPRNYTGGGAIGNSRKWGWSFLGSLTLAITAFGATACRSSGYFKWAAPTAEFRINTRDRNGAGAAFAVPVADSSRQWIGAGGEEPREEAGARRRLHARRREVWSRALGADVRGKAGKRVTAAMVRRIALPRCAGPIRDFGFRARV